MHASLELLEPKGRRKNSRRELTLKSIGTPDSGAGVDVIIHNISTTGLLLESDGRIEAGQKITVDLPETNRNEARVVWGDGRFFGCAFDEPLSAAAVSASLLRSEPAKGLTSLADDEPQRAGAEIQETFGGRLKRLRKQNGLTLVELAHRMKVSRPTIWSWEADKTAPRRSKIEALAEAVGVSSAVLQGVRAKSNPQLDTDRAQMSDAGNALRTTIQNAKAQVAEAAGTSPDKITLIIQV